MNGDGSLDTTFGTGGIVRVDVTGDSEEGRAVGIQSDGKIVVAGCLRSSLSDCREQFNNPADFLVFRLDASGNLDPSFGSGAGFVTTDVSPLPAQTSDSAFDLLILPNGKIAVAGRSGRGQFRVVMYASDGTLDSGFGAGGISELAEFNVTSNQANGMALQADGNLVVGGSRGTNNGFAIVRYIGSPPDVSVEEALAQLSEDLAAVQVSVDAIEGKLDTNLDTTVSSRATQTSVDDLDGDIAALEGKLDTNLNATVSSRASQASVDNLDSDVAAVEAKLDSIEGKLDTNLDVTVSSRATQTSVDAIEAKLDARLDVAVSSRASQASVTAINDKLDEDIETKKIDLQVINTKARGSMRKFLVLATVGGLAVDGVAITVLASDLRSPLSFEEVQQPTVTQVAPSVYEVSIILPPGLRRAKIFKFEVADNRPDPIVGEVLFDNR